MTKKATPNESREYQHEDEPFSFPEAMSKMMERCGCDCGPVMARIMSACTAENKPNETAEDESKSNRR